MKIRKMLKQIVKKDGKDSFTARKVNTLRFSKEFNYLVDAGRA